MHAVLVYNISNPGNWRWMAREGPAWESQAMPGFSHSICNYSAWRLEVTATSAKSPFGDWPLTCAGRFCNGSRDFQSPDRVG